MDISDSIIPRSDQLNAEDLLTGPRTVTVAEVRRGSAEQPVDIVTQEFGPKRPFKPSKTVRRILVAAWGPEAASYVGRRMTLYRDPAVRFGGMDVGGIRVSHLSHIDKRITLALTVTRGRRANYVVDPLPTEEPMSTPDQQKRLAELLDEAGEHDKAGKLRYLSERFGRAFKSAAALTATEAASTITHLESSGQPDEPGEQTQIGDPE